MLDDRQLTAAGAANVFRAELGQLEDDAFYFVYHYAASSEDELPMRSEGVHEEMPVYSNGVMKLVEQERSRFFMPDAEKFRKVEWDGCTLYLLKRYGGGAHTTDGPDGKKKEGNSYFLAKPMAMRWVTARLIASGETTLNNKEKVYLAESELELIPLWSMDEEEGSL
jgi:hypothetical protein